MRRNRKKHPQKARDASREWAKRNPEKRRESKHAYRANKRGNGGAYTSAQWIALCDKYHNRCLRCGKKKKLTPDHVLPISKGGTSNIENIQPLCLPCNLHKGKRTTDYRRKHATA
jgi:5-methylcytosine-specific restriction endonuclease McrA